MPQPGDPNSVPLRDVPPVAHPVAGSEPSSPLTEADYVTLRQAAAAYRPVRNAARVAHISAMTILAIAALSALSTVFSPGLTNLVSTAGLAIIGYLEYAGAQKMKVGLPAAASHLGWNQVIFIALICIYCVGRMLDADDYLSAESRSQLSQVPELAAQLSSLLPAVVKGTYALVMGVSIVAQGSLAAYYFSRRKHLESLQYCVPAWVRRVIGELARQ